MTKDLIQNINWLKKEKKQMKDSEYSFVRLQEVVDDMSQALQGLAKSLNKTKRMVEVLGKTKQAQEFKEDCDEMMKAHDAKQKEYDALLAHRNLLNVLLQQHKDTNEHDKQIMEEVLLKVFVGFNVIQDEALEKTPEA